MARSLVIVESPAKAKTINKYLGRDYTVKASIGHVMDLPKKTIGIRLPDEEPKKKKKGKGKKGKAVTEKVNRKPITLDDAKIFEPTLQIISGKGKVINDLRKSANSADFVYLAGDPDREGEAISAHLALVLSKPTKYEEEAASKNGDKAAAEAKEKEEAEAKTNGKGKSKTAKKNRDEISIPPIDPKKIFRVTFNEITPKAIRAAFEKPRQVDSNLVAAQQARRVLDRIVGYKISPLLWDKARRGLPAGRLQPVALRLILEREQRIKPFVPQDALQQVREFIPERFGSSYLPEKPNYYKSKKDAQEAHEAVRPTDVSRSPEDVRRYLPDDQFKLYQLIWQRFVASQMLPAIFDQTSIDISAGDYTFRASGSVQKFDGYLRVYQMPVAGADREDDEKDDEGEGKSLPRVTEGQTLRLDQIRPDQHFTEPPPRYTEATLVKELEEKGIGRPSTYASIISTIVEREYVRKDQGRFTPTMLGERVSVLLVKSFDDVFDVTFTARLEEELDEIEGGKLGWRVAVREFWEKFVVDLAKAGDEMVSYKAGIPTGKKCEKCGEGELLERISRHGFFLGCTRYPDCDFIQDMQPELTDDSGEGKTEYCENCGKEMAIKRGRFGAFMACTGYPDCKTTRRLVEGTRIAHEPDEPLEEKCTLCGNHLIKKSGRFGQFIGCSGYPKCKYTRPITMGIKCPKCNEGEFVRRGSAGKGGRGRPRVFYGCSRYPDCDFTTPHMPLAEPCPKCGAPFIVEKKTKIGTVRSCLKEGCDWESVVADPMPAQPEEAATPVGAKP